MSDGLVDRVARAIADSAPSFSGTVGDCDPAMFKDEARAAIAAVAEWLDEHHQIDKDGSVHCALTRQYTQKESK